MSDDLSEMMEFYHQQLLANDDKRRLLEEEEGITNSGILEFKLGYIDKPYIEPHDTLSGHIVVPYRSATGKVVALRYDPFGFDRGHGGHAFGWIARNYPFRSPEVHLFNVGHSMPGLRTNEVMLVEDVHSVILLRQEGYRAVAAPSYENFYEPWFELFRESRVTVSFSDDRLEQGREMMKRLRRLGISHSGLALPSHTTIGDLLLGGMSVNAITEHFAVTFGISDDAF